MVSAAWLAGMGLGAANFIAACNFEVLSFYHKTFKFQVALCWLTFTKFSALALMRSASRVQVLQDLLQVLPSLWWRFKWSAGDAGSRQGWLECTCRDGLAKCTCQQLILPVHVRCAGRPLHRFIYRTQLPHHLRSRYRASQFASAWAIITIRQASDGQISNPNLTLKHRIFETQIPNPMTKVINPNPKSEQRITISKCRIPIKYQSEISRPTFSTASPLSQDLFSHGILTLKIY